MRSIKLLNITKLFVVSLVIFILLLIPLRYAIKQNDYLDKVRWSSFLYEDDNMGASILDISYWDPKTTKVETYPCATGDLCRVSVTDKNTISNYYFFADGIDTESFELIGSCAEKIEGVICYAKDQNNYYRINGLMHDVGSVRQPNVAKLSTDDVNQIKSNEEYEGGYSRHNWSLYLDDDIIYGVDLKNFHKVTSIGDTCRTASIYADGYRTFFNGKFFNTVDYLGNNGNSIFCAEDEAYTMFEHSSEYKYFTIYFKDQILYEKRGYEMSFMHYSTYKNLKLLHNKNNFLSQVGNNFYCGNVRIGMGDRILQVANTKYGLKFDVIDNLYALVSDSDEHSEAVFLCKNGKYKEILRDKNIKYWIYDTSKGESYVINNEIINYSR